MTKHPDYARPDQTLIFLLLFNLVLWLAMCAGVLVLLPALLPLPLAGTIVAIIILVAHWQTQQLPY